MKLSIFYDHLLEAAKQRSLPVEAVFAEARALGIGWVEINLSTLLADREGVMALLEKTGLGISCIYAMHDWANDPDYASGRTQVEMARACGARAIMLVPGQLSPEEAEDIWRHSGSYKEFSARLAQSEGVARMVQGVRETVALAGDLPVCMEDFDQRTAVYAGMLGLRYFLEQVPGLGLAFDCGNFAYMDEDALRAWAMIGSRTIHVHCKDRGEEPAVLAKGLRFNRGLAAVATGSGYLPLETVIRQLQYRGYEGVYAIEHFGAKDQLQAMRDSVKFMKSVE